jgi:hypothetical protein
MFLCYQTKQKSRPSYPIPHTFNIARRNYGFFRKKYKPKRQPKLNSGKICLNPDEKLHKAEAR